MLVRFPIHGARYAVHPGAFTNPVQMLRIALDTADAINEFVQKRHGFRLSDLIEVCLSYSDLCLEQVRPTWPTGTLSRDSEFPHHEDLRERIRRIAATPVQLTEHELRAAPPLPRRGDWISRCAMPSQADVALRWATQSSRDLQLSLGRSSPLLGKALIIETSHGDWPVPVALALDALAASVAILSAEAAHDRRSRAGLQWLTEEKLKRTLGQPPRSKAFQEEVPSGVGRTLVSVPTHRRAFALAVASGLNEPRLMGALNEASRSVRRLRPAAIRSASPSFDQKGVVHRLVIYGGPLRLPPPARRGITHLHVDELLEASLEIQQTDAGREAGRDYLWQFLEELSTLPGINEVLATDVADIFHCWLDNGVLNPGAGQRLTVMPNPVPDERAWTRAAAWEPIERVLTAANLPPSWEWLSAHLDEVGGHATVGLLMHPIQVLANPPLLLSTPLNPTVSEISLDPAFVVGLADGVRLTIARSKTLGELLTLPDGAVLVCELTLTAERYAPDGDGARVVQKAERTPRPLIRLRAGLDWLELLAREPAAGHATFGRAFADALAELTELTATDRQRFLNAWCAAPPVAMTTFDDTGKFGPAPTYHGRVDLPRTPATRGRARRALARQIVTAKVAPGFRRGDEARSVCLEGVLPAGRAALAAMIAQWSTDSINVVADHLNDAYAERAREELQLAQALEAPWGPYWQNRALSRPEPVWRTRPLELLFETLLARASGGTIAPDSFDIAEATDLAELLLELGLTVTGSKARLHDLQVAISEDGLVVAIPATTEEAQTPASPHQAEVQIDMTAFVETNRLHRIRLHPDAPTNRTAAAPNFVRWNVDEEEREFRSVRDLELPGSLRKVDRVLQAACGTGLDGINAVLGTAVSWQAKNDSVVEVARADLRREVMAWAGLSAEVVDAALDRLVLEPDQLREDPQPYWEQERRKYRLATRPLVAWRLDHLLLIPCRVHATQQVYRNYLMDGRLPWHSSEIPQSVQDALVEFRKTQNKNLERQAAHLVTGMGLTLATGIEPHHAHHHGLMLTGEVDLLVADSDRSRLWVCEVKDLAFAVSPTTLASRVQKFLGRNGYVAQLTRAAGEVLANPVAAARLLAVPDAERDWRVIPLMVTRRVEPAGFARGLTVTFVAVDDLPSVLARDTVPTPGHAPVSPTVPV